MFELQQIFVALRASLPYLLGHWLQDALDRFRVKHRHFAGVAVAEADGDDAICRLSLVPWVVAAYDAPLAYRRKIDAHAHVITRSGCLDGVCLCTPALSLCFFAVSSQNHPTGKATVSL